MARDSLRPQAPPSPSRADSRAIVEAIVEATIELASPEVTTSAIAQRAGVGIASLYRYFPNRGAIFAEISRRLLADFSRELNVVLARTDLGVAEFVRAVCQLAIVRPNVSNELRRALNVMVPLSWSKSSVDEAYGGAVAGIEQSFRQRLRRPPDDLATRVFVVFSAIRGVISMSMIYPEHAPSNDELTIMLAETILSYVERWEFAPRASIAVSGRREARPTSPHLSDSFG